MLLQKMLFISILLLACSAAMAQSESNVFSQDFGSFVKQTRSRQQGFENSPEAMRTSVFSAPFNFSPKTKKPGSVVGAAAAGILGGVAGFVSGALIGLSADNCNPDGSEDEIFCNLDTGFFAGSAGGAVMMAVGVHVGNGRHGRFDKDLLVSVLIGGAGVGLGIWAKSLTVLFSVPIVQLIGTVIMERKATPAK